MKKLLSLKMKERWLAILAITMFILLLIPLIRITFYAIPWYDDYNYARFTKSFLAEEGGLKGIIDGVWYMVHSSWYAWQGTFSSIFMMALNPCFLGEKYYSFGLIGIILFFTFAAMLLSHVIARYVLKADRSSRWLLGVIVTSSLIELIYTAQQGLFWYNAGVHYTFMHSCLMIMLALVICLLYSKKVGLSILFCLLTAVGAIVCGGSNYVTALQGFLLLLTLLGLSFIFKKKKGLWIIFPFLCYAVAFYINISAPGNNVRGAYFQGYDAIHAVGFSFIAAGKYFFQFVQPMMVIVILLLLPLAWNLVIKLDYQFRFPGLVSLFSFCLYATGFTPSLYGMGSEGLARTLVVVKITLQLLIYVNLFYWLGWLSKLIKKKKELKPISHFALYYVAVGLAALGVFCITTNKAGSYASYGAYYYVHTGEAKNFHDEYLERIELINQGDAVIKVKPYTWQPWILFNGDLSDQSDAEQNRSMAVWYGKEAIYVDKGIQ